MVEPRYLTTGAQVTGLSSMRIFGRWSLRMALFLTLTIRTCLLSLLMALFYWWRWFCRRRLVVCWWLYPPSKIGSRLLTHLLIVLAVMRDLFLIFILLYLERFDPTFILSFLSFRSKFIILMSLSRSLIRLSSVWSRGSILERKLLLHLGRVICGFVVVDSINFLFY